jgi:transcriptional regulator with XRE-family HTH domain
MKTDEPGIGVIVRFHRKRAGLSQAELARLAGVGKTVVFDVENNKQSVQCSTLKKILHALNISMTFESPLMKELEQHANRHD